MINIQKLLSLTCVYSSHFIVFLAKVVFLLLLLYSYIFFMQAPKNMRIHITELQTYIAQSTDCMSDFLVVNGYGDRCYPKDNSEIFCDSAYRSSVFKTKTNELVVAYQKTALNSQGFKMKVKVSRS